MNDHIAGEDLAAYVDGALKGEAKAGVEAHLSRCPGCLEALAEIVEIQGDRVKIPGEFLRRALKVPAEGPRRGGILDEKKEPAWTALPMRLAFGAAAVFLVAVVLGYFFLGGDRFGRAGSAQKERSDLVVEKTVPEKKAEAGKPVPVAIGQVGPATGAKAKRKQLGKGAAASPPSPEEAAKKAGPVVAPAGAMPALADEELEPEQKREAGHLAGGMQAQAEKDKSAAMSVPFSELSPGLRIRVAGDVSRTDLRNPDLLDAWSWFPKGMAMELAIAADGSVSTVKLVGQWDQQAAVTARAEAVKLLFSASGTRSRRAVLTLSDASPN
jgi:anti-sigma factor RsiW